MDVTTGRTRTRRSALVTLTALVLTSTPALATPALAAAQQGGPAAQQSAATAPAARPTLPGLLRPVRGGTPSADPAPGVARSQRVVVDAEVLPDTPAEAARGVELPLFADTAVVAELEPPSLSPTGYQVWNGTLAGADDSSVVLVEQRGQVTGYVADEAGGSYRIRPVGDGTSVVEELDTSVFPDAHEHPVAPASATATPHDNSAHDHSAHDHSAHHHSTPAAGTGAAPVTAQATADAPVIDVLVAYSTAAMNVNGGRTAMEADAALAVEQTNAAFDTSGINARMRLVHTVEVPTNGNADVAALRAISNPADGVNDAVGPLRDHYGADVVALIVDDTANVNCGIAWQMAQDSPSYQSLAFSVTDAGCSTRNLTFAHEVGHNFGAAHDRGSWSGSPAYPYGYDWVNDTAKWRTVMSYANACRYCTRLLRFSNPDQTLDGAPVGAPIGAPNAADNRALINTTAATVSGYRGAAVPATLTVTAPTAGASVVAPGRTSITWDKTGNVGPTVKVELLRGSTSVAVLAAAAPVGTGSLPWTVPATLPRGDDYRVRISSVAVPAVSSATDPFSVVDPSLTVTSQATDDTWTSGTPQTVTWSYTGAPTGGVRLELVRDGRVVTLLTTAAAVGAGGSGAYTFTPVGLGSYSDYRVRATLASFRASSDTSDADVTVAGPGAVHLTSPGGGQTWTAGSSHTVTWSTTGVVGTSVRVELVKGDVTAAVLGTVPAAGGSFTWRAPTALAAGSDYRVAVTAVSFPKLFDLSDAALTVDGTSVHLAAPTAAEWVSGTPRTLSWATTGVPGTALRLELVPSTGAPVVVAAAAPLAAGSHTWTPPLSVRTGVPYRLRGTVVGNALVTSTPSEAVVLVSPGLSLTAPTTSSTFTAGAPVDLSWSFGNGATSPVTLQLVRGTAVTTIASNVLTPAGGAGTYRWTPPLSLVPSVDHRLRVSASTSPTITATSAFLVELRRPTVALTAPASATSGTSASLSWQFSAPVTLPVRVDLLRGTTVVATPVASGVTATGAGSATWAVPATLPGGSYVLRVRPAATASTAVVEHALPITVDGPTVTVATPSGWARGSAVTATWSCTRWSGPSARVELLRGTTLVSVLATAAPQSGCSGSLRWTVPSTLVLAGTYAVRVTLPGSASATSAPFAVTA